MTFDPVELFVTAALIIAFIAICQQMRDRP